MMSISSAAGQRLAKAKARLDELNKLPAQHQPNDGRDLSEAMTDYCVAANAVARELVEQRFHLMEGD